MFFVVTSSVLGVCSSEEVIVYKESFIINSVEFKNQMVFNSHLMGSFLIVTFLCILMNWMTTERVSSCIEGILKVGYWIGDHTRKDDKIDQALKEIMEEEKTMILGLSPSSEDEETETTQLDKTGQKRMAALQKKRSRLLKFQANKEWTHSFLQGCLTSLSQFTAFLLRHLSDILLCIVIVLMVIASSD